MYVPLTITTPEWRHWHHFGVFIVNFGHISHFLQCFYCLLWISKCLLGQSSTKVLVGMILYFSIFLWHSTNTVYFDVVSCCILRNYILLTSINSTLNWFNTHFFRTYTVKKDTHSQPSQKIVNGWIVHYLRKKSLIVNVRQGPKPATGSVL